MFGGRRCYVRDCQCTQGHRRGLMTAKRYESYGGIDTTLPRPLCSLLCIRPQSGSVHLLHCSIASFNSFFVVLSLPAHAYRIWIFVLCFRPLTFSGQDTWLGLCISMRTTIFKLEIVFCSASGNYHVVGVTQVKTKTLHLYGRNLIPPVCHQGSKDGIHRRPG